MLKQCSAARTFPGSSKEKNLRCLDELCGGLGGIFAEKLSNSCVKSIPTLMRQPAEARLSRISQGPKNQNTQACGATYTGRMSYEYPTKDLPKKEKMAGEAFFICLKTGIENRKIKVLYETPVKSLVVRKGKRDYRSNRTKRQIRNFVQGKKSRDSHQRWIRI